MHNPTEQINSAKESISKYGGFYIGRYEAGVPSEATDFYVASSSSSEGATYEYENNIRDVSTYTPVIKRGNQVWNFISQVKAEEASKNICKDNSAVSSYLIDSNAWNYICKDILKDKLGEDITISTNYGNYSNTEINYEEITGLFAKHTFKSGWDVAPTYEYKQIPEGTAPKGTGSNRLELGAGLSDNFKKYNIYDMAGNMWEWTAETTNAEYGTEHQMINYAVLRGGCLNPSGSVFPIVRSDGNYFI